MGYDLFFKISISEIDKEYKTVLNTYSETVNLFFFLENWIAT